MMVIKNAECRPEEGKKKRAKRKSEKAKNNKKKGKNYTNTIVASPTRVEATDKVVVIDAVSEEEVVSVNEDATLEVT